MLTTSTYNEATTEKQEINLKAYQYKKSRTSSLEILRFFFMNFLNTAMCTFLPLPSFLFVLKINKIASTHTPARSGNKQMLFWGKQEAKNVNYLFIYSIKPVYDGSRFEI
jgi:hypothetical protein